MIAWEQKTPQEHNPSCECSTCGLSAIPSAPFYMFAVDPAQQNVKKLCWIMSCCICDII